jgi:preprotein translocase subunit SecD
MRLQCAAVAAILAAVLGCSDDDFQVAIEITVEADLSSLQSEMDPDEAMDDAATLLRRRIEAAGVDGRVTVIQPNLILVEIGESDLSEEEAARLFDTTAFLEFREVVRDEGGDVVCFAPDGSEFTAPAESVAEGINGQTGAKEGQCQEAGAVVGLVQWQPATGLDSSGVERALTGAFVSPRGAGVLAEVEACRPACLTLEFTSEGGLLFEQITERNVNYPLAFFLDETLISAPVVRQPILGSTTVVEGLEVEEAETLAIQLNAGALPVHLMTVSVQSKD